MLKPKLLKKIKIKPILPYFGGYISFNYNFIRYIIEHHYLSIKIILINL